MINKKVFIILATTLFTSISFATNGYLGSSYSSTLKSGQGECIHSSSFGSDSEQLSECNK